MVRRIILVIRNSPFVNVDKDLRDGTYSVEDKFVVVGVKRMFKPHKKVSKTAD